MVLPVMMMLMRRRPDEEDKIRIGIEEKKKEPRKSGNKNKVLTTIRQRESDG